jgi:tetratricopeptide (TPR) repeat protein
MMRKTLLIALLAALPLAMPASSALADVEKARALYDEGKYAEAVAILEKEMTANPANEPARMLLADTYEKTGERAKSIENWEALLKLSVSDENIRRGRRAISRLRRAELDQAETVSLEARSAPENVFYIDMPEIDWKGLEVVEDTNFLPPILPPPDNFPVPPFKYETHHFSVWSHNERLSKVVAERAELYLDFMTEHLFGGKSWAPRFPVVVYKDEEDYIRVGGAPPGSHGVTSPAMTGRTTWVLIFQLDADESGQKFLYKYAIESILPHELTHAMINEFFGAARSVTPQWLHEAVAGRFEQTRKHYREAGRLARSVVAGEFFRMRDLFEQVGYPARVGLFYEQSASVVLYLFETGPHAMYTFLSELAAGNGHDAACAAVFGIPETGAVEEFERRWVEWMKYRYVKDLNDPVLASPEFAKRSSAAAFKPFVHELKTVEDITEWRSVALDSLDGFAAVGDSKKDWSARKGVLRCDVKAEEAPSVLGIRMNEYAPCAITLDVSFKGDVNSNQAWFGVSQLDADQHDTDAKVIARFDDNERHSIVALWLDDLVVYVDGKPAGRYPSYLIGGNMRDSDYPLGLVAYGAFEIENLKAARITKFSEEEVVLEAIPDATEGQTEEAPPPGRRRPRRPPSSSGSDGG